MDGFVLDCSLTMSWCFADEADSYANAILEAITSLSAIVPPHWRLEVNHALLRGERRGRITADQADEFLELLEFLPITIDEGLTTRVDQETCDSHVILLYRLMMQPICHVP